MDVPKETAVAIAVVEPRIRLELDPISGRRETLELQAGLTRVALALPQLGRIDLHEADAVAPANVKGVAVPDPRNCRRLTRRLAGRLRAARDRDEQEEASGDGPTPP